MLDYVLSYKQRRQNLDWDVNLLIWKYLLKLCYFISIIVNGIDDIVWRLNSDQCNKKVIKQGNMAFQMWLFGNIIWHHFSFMNLSLSNPSAFLWITKEVPNANSNHFSLNWYWFKTFILWPNQKCFKILSMNMVTNTDKNKVCRLFLSRRGLKPILVCT